MILRNAVCLTLSAVLLLAIGCEKKEAAPADPAPDQSTTKAPADSDAPSDATATEDTTPENMDVKTAVELPEFDDLEDLMKANGRALKFLFRNTGSGDSAELLEHATTLRAQVKLAHDMTPKQVKRAEGDEKTQLQEAYNTHLDEVALSLDHYITAINADDRDAAGEDLQHIKSEIEAGHKALGVKEH